MTTTCRIDKDRSIFIGKTKQEIEYYRTYGKFPKDHVELNQYLKNRATFFVVEKRKKEN